MGIKGKRMIKKDNSNTTKRKKKDPMLEILEAEFERDRKIANGEPLSPEERYGSYHPGLGCWM